MAQQMTDVYIDTVRDHYDRIELFSSLLFHTVCSPGIWWQMSHRWKLTPLNQEDVGTFFDLWDYLLHNFQCVLHKLIHSMGRCCSCMFIVGWWEKCVSLLVIWCVSSVTPGNGFNFLNLFPFSKFKIKCEISVDICSRSLTFPVHSSASVPFNQAETPLWGNPRYHSWQQHQCAFSSCCQEKTNYLDSWFFFIFFF